MIGRCSEPIFGMFDPVIVVKGAEIKSDACFVRHISLYGWLKHYLPGAVFQLPFLVSII